MARKFVWFVALLATLSTTAYAQQVRGRESKGRSKVQFKNATSQHGVFKMIAATVTLDVWVGATDLMIQTESPIIHALIPEEPLATLLTLPARRFRRHRYE